MKTFSVIENSRLSASEMSNLNGGTLICEGRYQGSCAKDYCLCPSTYYSCEGSGDNNRSCSNVYKGPKGSAGAAMCNFIVLD